MVTLVFYYMHDVRVRARSRAKQAVRLGGLLQALHAAAHVAVEWGVARCNSGGWRIAGTVTLRRDEAIAS